MNQPFITPQQGEKPLKAKAYGSIGHLPSSRMGPADHAVTPGMEAILTTKPRKGDRIIVSEKLDGSCMSVANIEGELVALTRSGYRANEVTYPHLRAFHPYVLKHKAQFASLLQPGERVVGEWMPMAHGTLYDPRNEFWEPFMAFDIFREGKRILFDEFEQRLAEIDMRRPVCIHNSDAPCSVSEALARLGSHGMHGAIEQIEGAVWRVEREGRVDFLAKYVRPDKVDGKYFSNISGEPEVWFIDRKEFWV